MGLPSTGDPRERGLLSGTCGGAEEGVPWTILKKMVLGVPVRFTRIRCKKRGCYKRKTAQVTSIKAQIRLIFRDRLVDVYFSQFTGSVNVELPNFYTAERLLYNLEDSKGIPSHVPNWHRVRATTKTTSLDRIRLDVSK